MLHTIQEENTALPVSASARKPAASQLWNVIEFSRQFPELTLSLVTELNGAEQRRRKIPAVEELEFPPLIVPDLRELRPKLQEQQEEDVEEEIALFAAGRLPPPESPPADQKKGKTQIWQYLLTLFTSVIVCFGSTVPNACSPRQLDCKHAPFARRTVHADHAMMGLDDMLGNGQP
jgi:hypothetical protein